MDSITVAGVARVMAHEERSASEAALSAALKDLLAAAQAALGRDRQAAQVRLARATEFLRADLDRSGLPGSRNGAPAVAAEGSYGPGADAGHASGGARSGSPRAAGTAFRGGMPRWQVNRLVAYIDGHLGRPISSADLAALTGMSTGHFFRTFKATFGEAPFAYIARRRVERAQELMRTSSEPLCQIALQCGLCDQSHLTRLFRRIVGVTPRAWRREHARRWAGRTPGRQEATEASPV